MVPPWYATYLSYVQKLLKESLPRICQNITLWDAALRKSWLEIQYKDVTENWIPEGSREPKLDSTAFIKKMMSCVYWVILHGVLCCFYHHWHSLLLGSEWLYVLLSFAFTEITTDPPCLWGIQGKNNLLTIWAVYTNHHIKVTLLRIILG